MLFLRLVLDSEKPNNLNFLFFKDKKNALYKYTIGRDVEYARLGVNKVIINTNTESISIQFSKDNGNTQNTRHIFTKN